MWPDVNDEMIEIEVNGANLLRRTLKLTEDEIKSLSIINKANDSLYNEDIFDYEQSFFRNSESFGRTMRRAVDFIACTLQKYSLYFATNEIPTGILDIGDILREI